MESVREIMSKEPQKCSGDTTLNQSACLMRDNGIGDVIVDDNAIVTDRDIAIRAVAEGLDCNSATLSEIASTDLQTCTPETSIDQAVDLMRSRAVRRLPVVENAKVVGVVSLGDLAIERDRRSALADISAAPANT